MPVPCTFIARQKAAEGIRTLDLVLTKDALYRLSYSSPRGCSNPHCFRARLLPLCSAVGSPITRSRALPGNACFFILVPKLKFGNECVSFYFGGSTCFFARRAGEGSRTLVNSLEGYGSTVELHPHGASDINSIDEFRISLDLFGCAI
jgi:hypothetical protein